MKLAKFIVAGVLLATSIAPLQAAEPLDKIAIVVNNGVILKSEIAGLVTDVKRRSLESGQELPSDKVLWTQAIDRLIDVALKKQLAERMGMRIGDAQLEQTIGGIAQEQKLTIDQLKSTLEKDGVNYSSYRESVREEILLGQLERISVRRRINISEQDVDNLVTLMKERGRSNTQYHMGHILIKLDTKADTDALKAAQSRASAVIRLLEKGDDFKRIALTSSSGPKALEGGDWGLMNIDEMPTLFTDAVQDKAAGDIIGPIKSGAGFHILKIFEVKGQQTVEVTEVNARHILITPSVILSEERAENMLIEFAQQIEAGEADFGELAKEHSADPGSAIKGGELGWTDPSIWVPAFKDAVASLEPGETAAPFRSTHGWHLLKLLGRRDTDATDKFMKNRAYQLLFNRKFTEESGAWVREMRAGAYIDIVSDDS